jgi:hypothetical protein
MTHIEPIALLMRDANKSIWGINANPFKAGSKYCGLSINSVSKLLFLDSLSAIVVYLDYTFNKI